MLSNILFNFSDVLLGENLFLSVSHYPSIEAFQPSTLEKIMAIISTFGMLSFCIGVFYIMKVLKTKYLLDYFSEQIIGDLKSSGLFLLFLEL